MKKVKLKQMIDGRKNWRENLSQKVKAISGDKKVWIHCASYGEFEQGRPLIEAIKMKHPHLKFVVSFFSSSGYEAFKNWEGADAVVYLPFDSKKNASDFLQILKPNYVVFVKYEFWLHYLQQLKDKKIPTYLVSAIFKIHHPFFKWYGAMFRNSLNTFDKLFIQDQNSAQLLKSIGVENFFIAGDTRFDRVLATKQQVFEDEKIKQFKTNKLLIIAGSTWASDEDLVLKAFIELRTPGVKLIIAPHEIDENRIKQVVSKLETLALPYSLYTNNFNANTEVLILDTIGILSKAYRYANCAYVGGGFDSGLHNILEPTVYQIPVSFYGEDYINYNEAIELLNLQVASKVNDSKQLMEIMKKHLFDIDYANKVKIATKIYFEKNGNSSERILKEISFE